MADKKISQLTGASTPLAGTEVLPIVQSGATVKVSVDNLTAGKAVGASSFTATSSGGNQINLVSTGNLTTGSTAFIQFSDSAAIRGNIGYGGSARLDLTSGAGMDLDVNATNGTLTLSTGNTPRATLTNAGNIAIANGNLVLSTSGTGIVDANGNEAALFTATASAVNELTIANAATGNRPTISATGGDTNIGIALTPKGSGDVAVTTGNVVISTAGKGIDFSANTHAAGMTSELLNWYEEGTWTPVLTFGTPGDLSVAYSTQVGRYTRIGRQVTVIACITTSTFTHTTASGNLNITGLPFTSANVTGLVVNGTVSAAGWTKTCEWITPQLSNNSAVIYFQASTSGSSVGNLTTADVPTATQQVWRVALSYFV